MCVLLEGERNDTMKQIRQRNLKVQTSMNEYYLRFQIQCWSLLAGSTVLSGNIYKC